MQPGSTHPLAQRLPPGTLSILAALLLLAAAIAAVLLPFRLQLRSQLAHRDASVLAALVQQRLSEPRTGQSEDPMAAVLDASVVPELPGLLELHLFSPEGHPFLTLLGHADSRPSPPWNAAGPIPASPIPRFIPGHPSRLELWLPLRPAEQPDLLGIAYLAFDGSSLAAEYTLLDRALARRALLAFLLVGSLLAASLLLAFRRLDAANRQLVARSHQLEAANRELSLAARTSAVGAVASHLVHGLRNPLASLQHAVASGSNAADAAESTRRMRSMIDDVVRVLRDEQGLAAFDVPMDEILAEAARKSRQQAPEAASLQWNLAPQPGPTLDNRAANLCLLILENLCVNAAQALHGRGSITLRAAPTPAHAWRIEVEDSGPGIPEAARQRLFIPKNSSKPGGSGLGLALSRHLARHLGGDLLLDHSTPGLTRFVLTIPTQRPAQ